MTETTETSQLGDLREFSKKVIENAYRLARETEKEINQLPDTKREEYYNNRRKIFYKVVEKIKSDCIFDFYYDTKQYLLYVVCNRAKLFGLSKTEMQKAATDLKDFFNNNCHHENDKITTSDYKLALLGYEDDRKVSNSRIQEKTGINVSLGSKREYSTLYKQLEKHFAHKKRLIALKRYVKKGYSVNKMLDMLKDNGIGISRTALYDNTEYRAILKKVGMRRNRKTGRLYFYP